MASSNAISFIVAVSSSVVAVLLASLSFYERYRREKQQTLIHALEYLTGGSQKRSVGIALIEGLWYRGHPYYRAIIPALTNQAVYLLLQTESKGRHQFHNWLRIMDLVMRVPPQSQLRNYYVELIEALETRSEPSERDSLGIDIPPETALMWAETIRKQFRL
jgi:hypothetical protein